MTSYSSFPSQVSGSINDDRKQVNKIRQIANQLGISEIELLDKVHAHRRTWYQQEFSYQELLEIAREIKHNKHE